MKAIFLILFISGCASMDIDEKTTAESKTQCPIGYHLEQTAKIYWNILANILANILGHTLI